MSDHIQHYEMDMNLSLQTKLIPKNEIFSNLKEKASLNRKKKRSSLPRPETTFNLLHKSAAIQL